MKNIIIAIVVIVVLALGYWWWQNNQTAMPAQTAQDTLLEGEVNGAVAEPQWDAVGKDGAAAQ
jgi:cytoskeletal protein RodZ